MDEGAGAGLNDETELPSGTPAQLRVFGLGLATLLALVGHSHAHKGLPAMPWFASAAVVAAIAAIRPGALGPVYRPWMRVAGVIGRVNVFLLLGLLYVGFAVVGRCLRWLGRDLLEESIDRSAPTYWKDRAA